MRFRLGIAIISMGLVAGLYFAWSFHRVSSSVMVDDMAWPRPWPYSDGWLSRLNDWLDAQDPAAPEAIKLHSEFPGIRWLLGFAVVVCLIYVVGGIGLCMTDASDG
jgi:hypothetical protein